MIREPVPDCLSESPPPVARPPALLLDGTLMCFEDPAALDAYVTALEMWIERAWSRCGPDPR